jgi:hypothetical protein
LHLSEETPTPQLYPTANIPTQLFPAAELLFALVVDDVATTLVSPEYVYLLRTLKEAVPLQPSANIPIAHVPAAAPAYEYKLEAVALPFASLEYVYLFLAVVFVHP